DAAGNPGAAGSTGDFTVDTVAPTIAIDAIAVDNTVRSEERRVGKESRGTRDAESGQTVTVQILDGSSAVVDSYTVPVAGGTWSVDVTAAHAKAIRDGCCTGTTDVADYGGNPATQATHGLAVDETAPSVVVSSSDP